MELLLFCVEIFITVEMDSAPFPYFSAVKAADQWTHCPLSIYMNKLWPRYRNFISSSYRWLDCDVSPVWILKSSRVSTAVVTNLAWCSNYFRRWKTDDAVLEGHSLSTIDLMLNTGLNFPLLCDCQNSGNSWDGVAHLHVHLQYFGKGWNFDDAGLKYILDFKKI